MWTYVLDPASSMKENRGCNKEMRERGGRGYRDFSYSRALIFCYMQGTENAGSGRVNLTVSHEISWRV